MCGHTDKWVWMVGHAELDMWPYRLVGVDGWACRIRCVAIQISGCGWLGMQN